MMNIVTRNQVIWVRNYMNNSQMTVMRKSMLQWSSTVVTTLFEKQQAMKCFSMSCLLNSITALIIILFLALCLGVEIVNYGLFLTVKKLLHWEVTFFKWIMKLLNQIFTVTVSKFTVRHWDSFISEMPEFDLNIKLFLLIQVTKEKSDALFSTRRQRFHWAILLAAWLPVTA